MKDFKASSRSNKLLSKELKPDKFLNRNREYSRRKIENLNKIKNEITPEFKPSLLVQRNKNKSSKQLDLEKWGITSNQDGEVKENEN